MVRLAMGRRGRLRGWNGRCGRWRGLDRAGHPLAPRRGLRQRRQDDLFDDPKGDVIEAEQGARRLDLGVDEREGSAPVADHTEAALLGQAADLGKLLSGCYLEHRRQSSPMPGKRWSASGRFSSTWVSEFEAVGGRKVAGSPA